MFVSSFSYQESGNFFEKSNDELILQFFTTLQNACAQTAWNKQQGRTHLRLDSAQNIFENRMHTSAKKPNPKAREMHSFWEQFV